jgi:hypothetical protein
MRIFLITIFALVLSAGVAVADTTVLFESFEQDAASTAEVEALYPAWDFIPQRSTDSVRVVDGVVRLKGSWYHPTRLALTDSPEGAFFLSADVGTDPGHTCVNVGIEIGQNEIVFHPGHWGTALRVEGPGGFYNQNLGFTLAPVTLHYFTLAHDGEGLFEITLTDANNPGNTATRYFRNTGSIGGTISLTRASCSGSFSDGLFDNIEITIPVDLIDATIDIDPDVLNLRSNGRYITAYIELPEGYDVADIFINSVELNGEVLAEVRPTGIGDHDGDGIFDLMVKFDRASVQAIVSEGDQVEMTVTGELIDGTSFEGVDVIRVSNPGGKK